MSEPTPSAIPVAELLNRRVSFFKSVRSVRPFAQMAVGELLQGVRGGKWRAQVEAVRTAFCVSETSADAQKKKLPAVAFSGVFERRANAGLTRHSGLLCLDIDGLGDRLADARRVVSTDKHVLAAFASPSGRGLKLIVPVTARDGNSHLACFKAAEAHFKGLGLEVDPACKDVSRLCFASCDVAVWIATEACVPLCPSLLLSTPTPAPTPTPYTLHSTLQGAEGVNTDETVARVTNLKRLRAEDPRTCALYDALLLYRLPVAPNERNKWLADVVPFLFSAVSEPIAAHLARHHLERNRDIYRGSTEEHMKSLEKLWQGCEADYPNELSPKEAAVFAQLENEERAAFRIMRDLAKAKDGTFYMACDQIEARLGNGCNGWRLLNQFCALRIIEKVTRGQRWETGRRAKAATYRWLLAEFVPHELAAGVTQP